VSKKIKKYFLLIILFFVSSTVYASGNEKKVLNRFLYAEHLEERQKAFNSIAADDNSYKEIVLTALENYSHKPDKTPDALIYLAAFIKDKRYTEISKVCK